MATRDRSQGFGFIYMNMSELLKKEEWSEGEAFTPVPGAKTVNFNKDNSFVVSNEKTEQTPTEKPPTEQIKENLDRLQTLHHRIHVMLEELSQLSSKKKKNS